MRAINPSKISFNLSQIKVLGLLLVFNLYFCIAYGQGQDSGLQSYSSSNSAIDSSENSEEKIFVTINDIKIFGNKRTKNKIILRELDLEVGDIILSNDLQKILDNDKNKILNTRLFLSVKTDIINLPFKRVDILVTVSERWYMFPVPIFKLDARNFNDWWENQDRDFKRVSYGIKFYQYNIRGRNERLKLLAQFGFTKRFELAYRIPYIDRSQRNGLAFSVGYFENTNVAYKTEDHKQQFADFGKRTKEVKYGSLTFSHRPSFYSFHNFSLSYRNSKINDSIAILNPNFFLDGRTNQKYFRFHYKYTKERRDAVAYPLKGYQFTFEIDKLGLGIYDDINQLEFDANFNKYFDLNNNFYLSSRIGGSVSFPKKQPYINSRALGFRPDFIRGYELNVIEGRSFALSQITLKKRIFAVEKKLRLIKKEQFQTIPLALYFKTYFDSGIVNNTVQETENQRLVNRYLFGTGIGLDFVTYYDFVVRLEYSVNNFGERGFFLNFRSAFQ